MLFGFGDAGEGRRDEGGAVFEVGFGVWTRWEAGCHCEGVDEFEDEEAGECTAEVGDAVGCVSLKMTVW